MKLNYCVPTILCYSSPPYLTGAWVWISALLFYLSQLKQDSHACAFMIYSRIGHQTHEFLGPIQMIWCKLTPMIKHQTLVQNTTTRKIKSKPKITSTFKTQAYNNENNTACAYYSLPFRHKRFFLALQFWFFLLSRSASAVNLNLFPTLVTAETPVIRDMGILGGLVVLLHMSQKIAPLLEERFSRFLMLQPAWNLLSPLPSQQGLTMTV